VADIVPNGKTIRERALDALEALFKSQREHLPAGDPYGFAWDQVLMAPTTKWDFRKRRSIGIFDGHETKTSSLTMTRTASLRIALELAIVIQKDESPSKEINKIFGAVQRRIAEDPSLGGLVIDIQEVSNDHEVADDNQTHVHGVVFVDMQYRHAVQDPRRIA
jgi:hypothetical protein